MTTDLESAIQTVRFLSVDAIEKANSGHPGAPMGLAGIGVELFTRYLRYVPDDPTWPNRDRFVLSCGHASMLLYSLLHLAGYDLPLEQLKNFRQWGSKTPGHPEVGHTPGVETTTGPLGQGFGNGVGMALALKMASARVDAPGDAMFDARVFVLASDGDLMEGVASEAASLAGLWGLGNLVVVYDDNHITIDGTTDISFTEDVGKRFEAYGWFVQHIDGHDQPALGQALDAAVAEAARPSIIVARTHIAIGAPNKQDTSGAHGAPLGAAEVEATKRNAGWPLDTFVVPESARRPFAAQVERNRALRAEWIARRDRLPAERRRALDALLDPRPPADLLAKLLAAAPSKADATRSLAATVQQQAAALLPALVGGSADLAESCKTTLKGAGHVARGEFAGRNIHFGIREHAMGSICNGLALSGLFVPYCSTFLIFSDYMRPAIRLAALMGQQVVYVFTHDSIFVGEDGPTHQPVEQIASLRLIPNLELWRPASAAECALAWAAALERREGPTALVLSRQKLPELPGQLPADAASLGAYEVLAAESPDVTLLATGSEVGLALDAAKLLASKSVSARVMSVPCVDRLLLADREKLDRLLGDRRVALEAGRTWGWERLVGREGLCIGVDGFGASAPASRLAQEYGLTAEEVAAKVTAWRARRS
ncbi:MAG: transketolase [Polyangiaceae bacterium]